MKASSLVQFGSGWWFNDTDPGMHRQIETLQNHGVFYHFIGMLTRLTFLHFRRHDYFRRILTNFIAEQVHLGKYPDNKELLAQMVENICYNNAKNYFVVRD